MCLFYRNVQVTFNRFFIRSRISDGLIHLYEKFNNLEIKSRHIFISFTVVDRQIPSQSLSYILVKYKGGPCLHSAWMVGRYSLQSSDLLLFIILCSFYRLTNILFRLEVKNVSHNIFIVCMYKICLSMIKSRNILDLTFN